MDNFGPNAAGKDCEACKTAAGMVLCTAGGGSTPLTCKTGYSKIGTTCTACKVSGCMACTASADICSTCNTGYSKAADGKTCGACEPGC